MLGSGIFQIPKLEVLWCMQSLVLVQIIRGNWLPKFQDWLLMVLQGHSTQQKHAGLGQGPQSWAEGPPLIFQTVQNLGVVKKIKVTQEGILN